MWFDGNRGDQVLLQFSEKLRLRMASTRSRMLVTIVRRRLSSLNHAAVFLTVAFASEGRFEAALFARRDIEGVSLHFANNVFLLHFTLEATESAFERLVIAKLDFCHSVITCLSLTTKDVRLEMLMGLRLTP
jgi:hypothetical protein